MDQAIHFHTADGARQVDTEQSCTACGGDCPCPQACARREEALVARKAEPQPRGVAGWVAIVCGRRS